jgi:hypothetical protein
MYKYSYSFLAKSDHKPQKEDRGLIKEGNEDDDNY